MLRKKPNGLIAVQVQLRPATKELVKVARGLRLLLLNYGPPWYTSEADGRLRKALAEAHSALRSSASRRTQKR